MKTKLPKSFYTQRVAEALESIAEAVYAAVADLEDATNAQLLAYASNRCAKKITPAQFKGALTRLP